MERDWPALPTKEGKKGDSLESSKQTEKQHAPVAQSITPEREKEIEILRDILTARPLTEEQKLQRLKDFEYEKAAHEGKCYAL